eukprot:3802468-Amphidinium_carterae.1
MKVFSRHTVPWKQKALKYEFVHILAGGDSNVCVSRVCLVLKFNRKKVLEGLVWCARLGCIGICFSRVRTAFDQSQLVSHPQHVLLRFLKLLRGCGCHALHAVPWSQDLVQFLDGLKLEQFVSYIYGIADLDAFGVIGLHAECLPKCEITNQSFQAQSQRTGKPALK